MGVRTKQRPPILDWVQNGLLLSRPKVVSPEMFSHVTQNAKLNVARSFIMLNNILASLLPFAALVSSDQLL